LFWIFGLRNGVSGKLFIVDCGPLGQVTWALSPPKKGPSLYSQHTRPRWTP